MQEAGFPAFLAHQVADLVLQRNVSNFTASFAYKICTKVYSISTVLQTVLIVYLLEQ